LYEYETCADRTKPTGIVQQQVQVWLEKAGYPVLGDSGVLLRSKEEVIIIYSSIGNVDGMIHPDSKQQQKEVSGEVLLISTEASEQPVSRVSAQV
jgi:hypothetical protein